MQFVRRCMDGAYNVILGHVWFKQLGIPLVMIQNVDGGFLQSNEFRVFCFFIGLLLPEMVHKDDRPYLSYQLQQQQRHYASTTPGLEKKFESMTMTSSSSQPHLYYSREDPRSGHNQSPYSGQQFSGKSFRQFFVP